LGIAIVSLLVLIGVALIAIPVLARVFAEALGRNQNRPGNEKENEEAHGRRG
jgi:hypothetical protein